MKGVRGWLAVSILIGLLIMLALAAGNSAAEDGATGGWLPFAEGQGPAQPALDLLTADGTRVDLLAELPGCTVQPVEAEGQRFTRLEGEGYGHPAAIGMPDLPVLRRDVEIPFGATVSLELVSVDTRDYGLAELGLLPIYPLQPPLPKVPGAEVPFMIEAEFYAAGSLYPAVPVALGEPYVVRGHRVQPVEVWPVAYDPAGASLRLVRSVTFRLRLEGSDLAQTRALAERYASPLYQNRLARQVLNLNQGLTVVPQAQAGYLIVVADAYYDAMAPFVSLKESRGYAVTMTRLSEIPGGSSNTAIKAYVQQAYDSWPIPPSYLLLVGDTDTIPGWNSVSAGEITDLYYGTMDGASDWHPDIGRGRFPVRSPAQTTIMVNKYLDYANLVGQEPWVKKAAFVATCDQWQLAEGTHNYAINTYTLPAGYSGIFPNNPQPGGDKLYCVTYGAGRDDMQAAFNDGRVMLIYSGHGGHDGWEVGDYDQNDVRQLTNDGMLPFVASHACITGDFDLVEVFGETWVLQENQGALVFWGSSDSSYWDEDDVLERVMFDSLFAETKGYPTVATMTDDGLAGVEAAYPSSARYYWETYNVLGDPAVKVFMEPDLPTFTLEVDPTAYQVCSSGDVIASVQIGSILGYSRTVTLQTGPLPADVSAALAPAAAPAPFTSALTLTVSPGALAGDYGIVLTATDQVSLTLDQMLGLRVVTGPPAAPVLLSPPDGAPDQPFRPTLEWDALPLVSGYRLRLDDSPLFDWPLIDVAGIPAATYTPAAPLAGGRCYWWQVQGESICGTGDWAPPSHFSTVALELGLYDDIESGGGQWTHQAVQGVDHWQLSTAQSHSPTHAWFVPDDPIITDSRLWHVAPVAVGAGSTLSFWHRYEFEGTSYDGAVLEVSTNGGGSWQDLGPHITANGYNGTVSTGYSNPLGGRSAWTGDLTTWTQVEVDLGSLAGQNVLIRWRLGCDSSVSDVGWFIDDVQITTPRPPNPAPTLSAADPAFGSAFTDTPVQVTGSGFVPDPQLQLGDTWLMSVTWISSATVEAVVPAGMAGGVYTLTLTNGDCQPASLPDAFAVLTQCVSPTVTLNSDDPVELGQPVHLAAELLTGTPPLTYTWDLGGAGTGVSLDGPTPVFTYTSPGTYTVTLTVDNPCGSDTVTRTVEVWCAGPEAAFDSSGPVELGTAMMFTATVTGTRPIAYDWDFGGDGSGAGLTTATPAFTYTSPGTYTVTLTVDNPCGTDTVTRTVEVWCAGPEAAFASSGPVMLGTAMMFTATVTGTRPLEYDWDFGGDGSGAGLTTSTPSFTYTFPGTYTVTLTVDNPCGLATAARVVRVEPRRIFLPLIWK